MAKEETKLLQKSAPNYLSITTLTVESNIKECILVLPNIYGEITDRSLGLTKAELLKFVDDPWWMAVRRYSFISFWIVLLAIFTAACIIAIISTEQHCDMDKSTIHPINNSISANDSSPIKDLVSISRKFP